MKVSISRKLLFFYLAIIAVMAVSGVISLVSTVTLGRTINRLVESNFKKLDLTLELRTDSALKDAWANTYIITQAPSDLEHYNQSRDDFNAIKNKLKDKIKPGRESVIFNRIVADDKKFDGHTDEAIKFIQSSGDFAQARKHIAHRVRDKLDKNAQKLEFLVEETAEKKVKATGQYIKRSIVVDRKSVV